MRPFQRLDRLHSLVAAWSVFLLANILPVTRIGLLCLCTLNAFAAWVYRSAAFSHFSVLPPNKLNPPVAPCAAFSALCSSNRGSCAMVMTDEEAVK